jgi:hypothetical protein
MKRDMELVRLILLKAEEVPAGETFPREAFFIEDYANAVVMAHVKMMRDAGLIEVRDNGKTDLRPTGLTWDGSEFLDLVRPDVRWEKVKRRAVELGGSLGFEALKNLAIQVTNQIMGS